MREETREHTGLLRMGLEVGHSVTFWQQASATDDSAQLQTQALEQEWFPNLSPTRVKYLVGQLCQRFPVPARTALRNWRPQSRGQAPIVCHWHLQLADPLYREFTYRFLLGRWSTPSDEVNLDDVETWLHRRGTRRSPSTTRRLASGLFSAATEAGLLHKLGRTTRRLQKPDVEVESIEYWTALLASLEDKVDPSPYLLTAYWGEIETERAREAGRLSMTSLCDFARDRAG